MSPPRRQAEAIGYGQKEEIAERIELEAQASDADVVVMGTHGRRGMRRLMLGSVAEGLIRVASRPVLLVRDK